MADRTWEQGCEAAINELLAVPQDVIDSHLPNVDACEAHMRDRINEAITAINHGFDAEAVTYLRGVAVGAWQWMHLDGYDQPTVDWMVKKLSQKMADYGPGNINRFGVQGLVVRTSDKVERVSNMRAKGRKNDTESVWDSLFDMIGYATIGVMLNKGTFELPLYRDTAEGKLGGAVDAATFEEEQRAMTWLGMLREIVPDHVTEHSVNLLLGELMNSGVDPNGPGVSLTWEGV